MTPCNTTLQVFINNSTNQKKNKKGATLHYKFPNKTQKKKNNHDENVPEEDDQDEDNSLMLLKSPMTCTRETKVQMFT